MNGIASKPTGSIYLGSWNLSYRFYFKNEKIWEKQDKIAKNEWDGLWSLIVFGVRIIYTTKSSWMTTFWAKPYIDVDIFFFCWTGLLMWTFHLKRMNQVWALEQLRPLDLLQLPIPLRTSLGLDFEAYWASSIFLSPTSHELFSCSFGLASRNWP